MYEIFDQLMLYLVNAVLSISQRLFYSIFRFFLYRGARSAKSELMFINMGYLPISTEDKKRLEIVQKTKGWPEKRKIHLYFYENILSLCPLYPNKLKGLKTLEVGCAAGGGIVWYESAHPEFENCGGIDLCVYTTLDGKITKGDAMDMPIEDKSVDIVINTESSHLYKDINQFYNEVHRVLKPGGYFCYTDIAHSTKNPANTYWTAPPDEVRSNIQNAGLQEVKFVNVTKNVIAAHMDNNKQFNLVFDTAAWWGKMFRGTVIRAIDLLMDDLESGKTIYFAGCWKKEEN